MKNVKRSWSFEDRLDPNVDEEEIRHLTDLGLDFPFHVVEME